MYFEYQHCKKKIRIHKKIYNIIQILIKILLKNKNFKKLSIKKNITFIKIVIIRSLERLYFKNNNLYLDKNSSRIIKPNILSITKIFDLLQKKCLFIKNFNLTFSLLYLKIIICQNIFNKYNSNFMLDTQMTKLFKKNGYVITLKFIYRKKLFIFFIHICFVIIFKKQLEFIFSSFFLITIFSNLRLSGDLIHKTKIFQNIYKKIKFALSSNKKLLIAIFYDVFHFNYRNITI